MTNMFQKIVDKSPLIAFQKRKYILNLEKFKEVCTPEPTELRPGEYEVTQVSEMDDDGDFAVQSKVEHETKSAGNQQGDMIVYDVVKMLVLALLENDKTEEEFNYDFGTTLAINTLLSWGVLEEIKS